MSGNTFGQLFRVTTWGESHGPAVGVVVDGCPPRIPLTPKMIQAMLNRRRPGQTAASTPRAEADQIAIYSGVFEGLTTGTPIMLMVANRNADSSAYQSLARIYRPGHGDITYQARYGIRDWRGGGRASGRETVGRVAAGAVASAILAPAGIQIQAGTIALGGVVARDRDWNNSSQNPWGCPDAAAVQAMAARIQEVKAAGDSVGGVVEIIATGVPAGLGAPVFDKLDADLAQALMGIGAVKGVEIGAGFAAAAKTGSENNDPLTPNGFASNHAGGILAGISNGAPLVMRVAVKPIPSIAREQNTIDENRQPCRIRVGGRHDVCAIPRINVVCEAMVAIVLADHWLRLKAIQ